MKQNKQTKLSINNITKVYHKPVKTGDVVDKKQIKYKSKGDENEIVSIEECLKNIRPCFSDMINNFRTSGACKIHLTIKIIFMYSKDVDEKRVGI